MDEIAHRVFVLDVDGSTLMNRLLGTGRPENHGKTEKDLQHVLSCKKSHADAYIKSGHIGVDAAQPTEVVVNEILSSINES